MSSTILLRSEFYKRSTQLVAKELIGRELVRCIKVGNTIQYMAGTIVETEAYGSVQEDEASHAYRGMTKRNEVMFGPVGRAYVYFTYGNHYCVNVTAKEDTQRAGAILIRSINPTRGIELMQVFRNKDLLDLACGPGKLTR